MLIFQHFLSVYFSSSLQSFTCFCNFFHIFFLIIFVFRFFISSLLLACSSLVFLLYNLSCFFYLCNPSYPFDFLFLFLILCLVPSLFYIFCDLLWWFLLFFFLLRSLYCICVLTFLAILVLFVRSFYRLFILLLFCLLFFTYILFFYFSCLTLLIFFY